MSKQPRDRNPAMEIAGRRRLIESVDSDLILLQPVEIPITSAYMSISFHFEPNKSSICFGLARITKRFAQLINA